MKHINLSIGNIILRINGLDDNLFNEATNRYSSFIASSTKEKPHITINLSLMNSYTSDKPENPVLEYIEPVNSENILLSIKRYDFNGIYHIDKGIINIDSFNNIYSLDAIIRIIYSYRTIVDNALLLHSAGLVVNNNPFVFCGETLHGKSNIVMNSPGTILLSDEITLIRKIKGQYYVFGTPFWGEFSIGGVNNKYQLHDLYFLFNGDHNSISPISKVHAVQKLLSTTLLFINDKKINNIIFDTIMDIVNSIKCYKVIYNQKDDIWRELKYVTNSRKEYC